MAGLSVGLGVGITNTPKKGAGVAYASASTRLRQPLAMINTSANPFNDYRVFDSAVIGGTGMRHVFVNEYVAAGTARTETVGMQLPRFLHSVLTGLNGTSDDQSTATQTKTTFSDAKNDVDFVGPDGTTWSCIWKRNGLTGSSAAYVQSTYAEFAAAGGGISDGGIGQPANSVVDHAGGYLVISDLMPVSLAVGEKYAHQTNASGPTSTSAVYPGACLGNATTDRTKAAATFGASLYNSKNWTSAAGLSYANSSMFAPVASFIMAAASVKTVMVPGDSIGAGEPGDGKGDVSAGTGSVGFARRALTLSARPSLSVAVPSTTAGTYVSGGPALADWLTRWAHDVVSDWGHNERNSAAMTNNRLYNIRARALLRPGAKRVLQTTWAPQMTGGVNASALAISAITSSGTTATATISSTAALQAGMPVCIGASDVTGYQGVVNVVSITDGTHFTFTIPGGGSGLASATTAKLGYPSTSTPLTAYQFATWAPYVLRTGAYAGVPFDRSVGDPDTGWDLYAACGGVQGIYASLDQTQEGTHPLGNNTSGTSNLSFMVSIATSLSSSLPTLLP